LEHTGVDGIIFISILHKLFGDGWEYSGFMWLRMGTGNVFRNRVAIRSAVRIPLPVVNWVLIRACIIKFVYVDVGL
jgi:hypothetical protein